MCRVKTYKKISCGHWKSKLNGWYVRPLTMLRLLLWNSLYREVCVFDKTVNASLSLMCGSIRPLASLGNADSVWCTGGRHVCCLLSICSAVSCSCPFTRSRPYKNCQQGHCLDRAGLGLTYASRRRLSSLQCRWDKSSNRYINSMATGESDVALTAEHVCASEGLLTPCLVAV